MRTEFILPSPEGEGDSRTIKEIRQAETRERFLNSRPLNVPVFVINCADADGDQTDTRLRLQNGLDFNSPLAEVEVTTIQKSKSPKNVRSVSFHLNHKQPSRKTSSEQKIVRFADVLGLDLADVKHFCWDDPIQVPFSKEAAPLQNSNKDPVDILEDIVPKCSLSLVPTFAQPINSRDYFERLDSQLVLLESCSFRYAKELHGTIRVKNLDFHKRVFVRFSYCEDWSKWEESEAFYVPGPPVGFTDQFDFSICVDPTHLKMKNGNGGSEEKGALSFACRFECLAKEFWDNNYGLNYRFVAIP